MKNIDAQLGLVEMRAYEAKKELSNIADEIFIIGNIIKQREHENARVIEEEAKQLYIDEISSVGNTIKQHEHENAAHHSVPKPAPHRTAPRAIEEEVKQLYIGEISSIGNTIKQHEHENAVHHSVKKPCPAPHRAAPRVIEEEAKQLCIGARKYDVIHKWVIDQFTSTKKKTPAKKNNWRRDFRGRFNRCVFRRGCRFRGGQDRRGAARAAEHRAAGHFEYDFK